MQVYGVASEDMDSLTFGAPKFLRHLMDPSSKKIPVMEIEVGKVLMTLEKIYLVNYYEFHFYYLLMNFFFSGTRGPGTHNGSIH